MSAANFAKFFPSRVPGGDPLEVVDLGVVQLDAGRRPAGGQTASSPPGCPTTWPSITKAEMIDRERNFWSNSTPVGYIFLLGTVIGFLVGVIICYQIINSDIADHMPEFATLEGDGLSQPLLRRLRADGVGVSVAAEFRARHCW